VRSFVGEREHEPWRRDGGFVLIVSAREFSQLNANRLFNGNMCPIAFRSARGNSRVDCFGFGGCLSLPLPRSGEGVWSLWFDAHAGGLADVSLTQVPQPPRSPPAWLCLQICGSVWLGAFAPHLLESKRCTRAHRHWLEENAGQAWSHDARARELLWVLLYLSYTRNGTIVLFEGTR